MDNIFWETPPNASHCDHLLLAWNFMGPHTWNFANQRILEKMDNSSAPTPLSSFDSTEKGEMKGNMNKSLLIIRIWEAEVNYLREQINN